MVAILTTDRFHTLFVFEDSIVDSNTQLQGVVCLDSVVRGYQWQ